MVDTPEYLAHDERDAPHIDNLIDNLKEVDHLPSIHHFLHRYITGKSGRGRRRDVEILNKSAIVLLCACWEAFAEDLANAALQYMIDWSASPNVIPMALSTHVVKNHTGARAWELAGDGWKKALRDNLKGYLGKTTGSWNTPRSDNVDSLFEQTLGLTGISKSWAWRGTTANAAKSRLDRLVILRGAIAHRVEATSSVRLKDVENARELVCRLAIKSHNRVRQHLIDTIGMPGWARYKHGGTE